MAVVAGVLLACAAIGGYVYVGRSPRLRAVFFRVFCALGMDRFLAPRKFVAIHDPGCIPIADIPAANQDDPVMGIVVGDEARAYTLREAIWHHIIHDTVGGKEVLVTYCNLTFTPIAYDLSASPNKAFTVYGLHENNMIMKESGTGKLWLQANGLPLELSEPGCLPRLPVHLTTVREWARHWPDSTVFVGAERCRHDRGRYPHHESYLEYFETDVVALPLSYPDTQNRVPRKEVVTGVVIEYECYGLVTKELSKRRVTHLSPAGREIVVCGDGAFDSVAVYDPDGRRFVWDGGAIRDKETGSEWDIFGRAVRGPAAGARLEPADSLTAFWFALHNHFPNVELTQGSQVAPRGVE